MPDQIVRTKSPEERELDSKLAELAVLEEELAQRELQLTTIQAELKARVAGSEVDAAIHDPRWQAQHTLANSGQSQKADQ